MFLVIIIGKNFNAFRERTGFSIWTVRTKNTAGTKRSVVRNVIQFKVVFNVVFGILGNRQILHLFVAENKFGNIPARHQRSNIFLWNNIRLLSHFQIGLIPIAFGFLEFPIHYFTQNFERFHFVDGLIGLKRAVGITSNPALLFGLTHIIGVPLAFGNIGKTRIVRALIGFARSFQNNL